MIKAGGPSPNADTIQAVAEDADQFGLEHTAKKWGINIRTVTRYRKIARETPAIANAIQIKTAESLANWDDERMALIKAGCAKLMELIPLCDPDHIHPLVGMLKILVELDVVHKQLALEPLPTQQIPSGATPAGLWRLQFPKGPESDT